ncbi:arabinogalactan endo-1,4-beta-galactosidase [Motilibacter peucedani]|uniref:Arabinogalactan endo-beta-1,4-galactanase n=1 Tax=Motilibacter peucedani TaxID=598650 RepID=A0A420XTL2_9ACTN|nr:glycosyl hydrolase 53 family protein [Motilibacter peucedani]RKS80176.1 arabinogalactan endo-1,4-beta-galactosidase [Motilibacter peucedani]
MTLSRTARRLLTAVPLAALVLGTVAAPAQARNHETGALSIRGADLSFLPQLEEAGVTFRDVNGKAKPAERILEKHGADYMRIRVWVDPPAGYTDETRALALAKRAKKAGMKILLDPHYSDFWADPSKQPIPAGWPTALPALKDTVRAYTRSLVQDFANQHTPVDMIQVGNEITGGMLWPTGQLYPPGGGDHWAAFTDLLKAGVTGAKEGNPRHHEMKVMIHIDRGGDLGGTQWFFDHVTAAKVPFDVIGQSYYPIWHGSLAQLQANLDDSVARYHKPVVVVETAYPWTYADGDGKGNIVGPGTVLPDGDQYPATELGQAGFFEALRRVLLQVPDGMGLGFFDWEPEWVPGVGWQPGAEASNDNMTQFDFTGHALPSVYAYRKPDAS